MQLLPTCSTKPWSMAPVSTMIVFAQNFLICISVLATGNDRAVGSSPGVERLIDQSGDAAERSEIEARSGDQSARSAEKFFRLHFQLSGWALVALSYSED